MENFGTLIQYKIIVWDEIEDKYCKRFRHLTTINITKKKCNVVAGALERKGQLKDM